MHMVLDILMWLYSRWSFFSQGDPTQYVPFYLVSDD
jgi:hypothetical protein